jgi:alginate O-acetyltransferase complex protein AlgI
MGSFVASSYYFNMAMMGLLTLPLYNALNVFWRRVLLITLTLAGLFYIAPRLIVAYVGFWLVVAGLAWVMPKLPRGIARQAILIGCMVAGVAILMLYKIYPKEFWIWWNRALSSSLLHFSRTIADVDILRAIILPIGLSFAVFRAMDLLIKVYIGRLKELNFLDVLFYGLFPPVMMVGPIIEYEEIRKQGTAPVSSEEIVANATLFAIGLLEIFGASIVLKEFASLEGLAQQPIYIRWLNVLVHPWYFYLNFAGYSNLAIALAGLWGFKLKPNFNRPFLQTSPQSFWANWHMSLTRWAQRNVFVPLGGYRKQSQYFAIVCTMMAIAFWHDISWGLLAFGLYHSTALIAERVYTERYGAIDELGLSPAQRAACMAATFLFVALSFPLLEMSLGAAGAFYLSLISP